MLHGSRQSVIFTAPGCGCHAQSLIAAVQPVPETRFPVGLSQLKRSHDSISGKRDPEPRTMGLQW